MQPRSVKTRLTALGEWLLGPDPVPPVALPPLCSAKDLADIAIHAWKITRRAERDPHIPRPVGRNAEQILALLQERASVALVSYAGRRLDAGARVEVLEAVPGEPEGLVVEEHEPEVQVAGAQVRRAVLSVGRGRDEGEGAATK